MWRGAILRLMVSCGNNRPQAGAGEGPLWSKSVDGWIRLPSVWPDNAVIAPRAEVHVYPGALHGFNCWSRGSYQPAAAALAPGRSVAFLAQALYGA